MATGGRALLVALVAVALVVSPWSAFVGVAGGTVVQPVDATGSDAVYPGQTVSVLNVSVESEDEEAYPSKINQGITISSFGTIDEYAYIEHGTDSTKFQIQDDVIQVFESDDPISAKTVEVKKFNGSIVYIDDTEEVPDGNMGEYDSKDDIYDLSVITGDPYISDTGIAYTTFQSDTKYLAPRTASNRYSGSFPIVLESTSGIINPSTPILRDGSIGLLSDIPPEFEHFNDQRGSSGYDPYIDGQFGEPIYNSGGDGIVTAGVDTRITDVSVFSGLDNDVRTVNFNIYPKSQIYPDDEDVGVAASEFIYTPTINEIDPDGNQNSDTGRFGQEDQIVIDTTRDGYYDQSEDIVLQGNPTDGTPYTVPNIVGNWEKGTSYTNEPVIIFDKGRDGNANSDDLLIQGGEIHIGTADTYDDVNSPLKYWDHDGSNRYSGTDESVYFDVGDNTHETGGIDQNDFRLTSFYLTYKGGTVVSPNHLDAELALTQFIPSEKYIDDNDNSALDRNEAIISSDNTGLESGDNIFVSGSIESVSNSFSSSGDYVELYYGTGDYEGYQPIIGLNTSYTTTSGSYRTNSLTPDESTELVRFSPSGKTVEGYQPSRNSFRDGDNIVRLKWFKETSGEQIDTGSKSGFVLRQFQQNLKFEQGSEGYTDGSGIIREHDASTSTSHYGDRITALTVTNHGTVPTSAIESVAVQRNGTTIASATTATDDTWVLEPTAEDGVVAADQPTQFTVSATIAADAPVGATVDFELSAVDDAAVTGAYDPGDEGLFFADGPPVGGFGMGPSYSIADPSAIGASATAFPDPDRNGTAAIELAFTDDVNPDSTAPSDLTVENVLGAPVNVTGLRDDDTDGRLVVELESGTAPESLASVGVGDGAMAVASGAAVPGQSFPLETTSVAVTEAKTRPHVVYRGERLAALANDGPNGTANLDEAVRIDADTTDDGTVDELVHLGSTGPASVLTDVDTNASNASRYRVAFQSDDGDSDQAVTVPVRNLSLSVTANRTNTTDVAGPIGATVSAAGRDRVLRADLLEAENATVLESGLVRTDEQGNATVNFPARVANVTVRVTDLGTGRTDRSATVTVRKGYPGATFDRDVFEEERGDVARIGVRLVDTETATVAIGGESVNYHERVRVADADGDGRATVTLNTHRAGSNGTGVGIGLRQNASVTDADDQILGVERAHPAAPGLQDPLEVGEYALEATVDGEVTDLAMVQLGDRATSGASTLVAPAGVSLDSAGDVRNWTTPRETVAVGDQAIVAVNASGLGGVLDEDTDLRRTGPAAAKTGAYVDVERGNPPPNRPARHLNVSNASTVLDRQDDALYLVLRSGEDAYAVAAGERFDATFVLNESSPYVLGETTPDVVERESASTALAFETPAGGFADLDENETLDLPASAGATVAGETNVAPGTNVTVEVVSDDENVTFRETDTDRVAADGSFEGAVDLEEYPEGTEYTVVATANGDDLTEVRTGSIVEAPVALDAAQNVSAAGGTGGGSVSGAVERTTRAETTTRTPTATPIDDSVGERARRLVTEDVPAFIATQATNIVVGLGIVAVLYGLLGLRRLTR